MPEGPTARREDGEGPEAKLIVRLEGEGTAGSVGLPVEVRTATLLPAASGWTAEAMALPAGQYVVSARVPGGAPLLAEVALAPGEERTVVLAVGAAAPAAPGPLTAIAEAADTGRRGFLSRGRRRAPPGPPPLQRIVRLPARLATAAAPAVEVAPRARTVTFLLLSGNPLVRPLGPLEPLRGADAPSARFDLGGPKETLGTEIAEGGGGAFSLLSREADAFAIEVRADGDTADRTFTLLRMSEPGAPVRFIAVPIAWGHAIRIRVDTVAGEEALRVTVETDDPMTEALLLYRRAGQLDEARALLARHREESFGAAAGSVPPLRLAVIALLTLRLSDPREWKSGPFYGRLVAAAEDLDFPDLYAASAEMAARLGQVDRARLFTTLATEYGLPYLSDALALLHARVLEAARPPDPDMGMKGLYQRLSPLLGLVDLKAPLVTLRGGDELLYQPDPSRAERAALDQVEEPEPTFS